jgi:aspartyl-tRNA(Asn)/glutamyl-tRNA(Gln) amidotransferase subunit B
MRVDANVSVRPAGSDELRTRCEIKNVNSLRSLVRAIDHEAARHVDLWSHGEAPRQETRHWDEQAGRTTPGRSKEEAEDYRYFAEPDLVPVDPDPAWVESIRVALPVLPAARRARLIDELGAEPGDAALLVQRGLDEVVAEAAAAGAPADLVLTRAVHNLADVDPAALSASHLAQLVSMEAAGDLTATQAKQVLGDMVQSGRPPDELAAERGFEAMDSGDLEAIVDAAIAEHPGDWAEFCDGEDKVMGFFVGQVMKATQGNADGKAVSALLREKRSRG